MNQPRSTHLSSALHVFLVLAALPACGKSAPARELPPATGQGAPPREPLPQVTPAALADKAPTGTEQTIGTTYPVDRAEVSPDMSAIIESVEVDEGDPVKKRQVLFRLRTRELGLRVQQAEAQLRSAEVALSAAKVEYDRMTRLLEQKATEQAQFDRVKAQYDSAAVGVEQARVALAQARRAVNDAAVRSPIDGVVTEVRKHAGEMATMMPVTVVLVVEDQSRLELRFRLPESALGALKPGDTVDARFEAVGLARAARVDRMSPALDLRTRTFEVFALIDNQDGSLRSGMLAVVDIGGQKKPSPAASAGQAAARGKQGE